MKTDKKYVTIDDYHADFPKEIQKRLEVFRETILEVMPSITQVISYNMPAFKLKKVVVYYAAYKNHISLFPAPKGAAWKKEFEPYHTSGKGTIQFPYDKPLPVALIKKIVTHLVQTGN